MSLVIDQKKVYFMWTANDKGIQESGTVSKHVDKV